MIFKSLIAGTVLSALAGGVVYYGTDADLQNSTAIEAPISAPQISDEVLAGESLHPHKASKKPKGAGGKAFKDKSKKKAVVEEAPIEEAMADEAENEPDNSKKWVDEYVKPNADEAVIEAELKNDDESAAVRDEAKAEIDTMIFNMLVETEEIIVEAPELTEESAAIKDEAKAEIDTIPSGLAEKTEEAVEKTAEVEPQSQPQPKHKSKTCKPAKAMAKPDRTHKERGHKKARMKNGHCSPAQVSATVELITQQALKIELPELRDRAYLDLVSFALKHKDYASARTAIDRIDQVELRDTARNRMAIAYARHGQAEAAFELLEELEVEALSDVIRLQVIESIISPESLPREHQ